MKIAPNCESRANLLERESTLVTPMNYRERTAVFG